MSTLQIGLIIAGVLVVAAVWVYNLWQERQARKRMEAAFGPKPAGARPGTPGAAREGGRIEPTLGAARAGEPHVGEGSSGTATGGGAGGSDAGAFEAGAGTTPAVGHAARVATSASATSVPAGSDPDPEIECVATLQAASPVAGATLVEALAGASPPGVRWVGRAQGGAWQPVRGVPGEWYSEIAACALLADRDGPIGEADLRALAALVTEVAPKLPAAFRIPPLAEETSRAARLDRTCAEVDIQIGLTLVRGDGAPIAGTRLRGVAEAAGFRLNGAGQFDFLSEENGQLLFRMANLEPQPLLADTMRSLSTSGVTFLLDVPVVADAARAFDQMRALAKRLAVTLEATLVDDNRKPLSDAALGKIRSSIQQAHARMRAGGIEPGSARALRLFS